MREITKREIGLHGAPGSTTLTAMTPVLVTNDAVLLSFAEHVLGEAGIDIFVADRHLANAEGSIGIFPRRLMVADGDLKAARSVLVDADLGAHLVDLP